LFAEGSAVIFVGIGPAVYPNISEGIGGVIAVLDLFEPVEGVRGVVESDVDGIVDFLLPVRILDGRGGTLGMGDQEKADNSKQ
jgi:hypothetical protein